MQFFIHCNFFCQEYKFTYLLTLLTVLNKCPAYMNEVFRPTENMRINSRNSFLKLNHPF